MVGVARDTAGRADASRLCAGEAEVDGLPDGSERVGALRELVGEGFGGLFDESAVVLCEGGECL